MADRAKKVPQEIIAKFEKTARKLGIRMDLKNLDERINRGRSHTDAFPELRGFEYKSQKDFEDMTGALMNLWNNYPREEFGGKSPAQVFNESRQEAAVKRQLVAELMRRMDPNDFSSVREFKKAVDDFQKKWLDTPRKDLGGKTPMEVVLEERQKTGDQSKDLHISVELSRIRT